VILLVQDGNQDIGHVELGNMKKIILVLMLLVLSGCNKKHYTKKHPWQPKRTHRLDSRYERCYNWSEMETKILDIYK
jgi:uncharacterized protein YceK